MSDQLKQALDSDFWKEHKVGDVYNVVNVNGSIDEGWLVAYYPLFGTYKNEIWIDFDEPRALIEKNGLFKELPPRYFVKSNKK